MFFLVIITGFLFGAILQYASLNRYNVISGMATLENYAVAKAIATAIGFGAIMLGILVGLDLATWHVKPIIAGGIIIGGLIFGAGMAILGYCPGTLAISAGEGSIDAWVGIAGGLVAGLLFTVLLPTLAPILGPDFGTVSLASVTGTNTLYYILVFLIGIIFISISFWLHKIEKAKNYRWLHAGIALGILNPVVFLAVTFNRQIGASTAYPYLADVITDTTQNSYFANIQKSGNWEVLFLGGAFFAGLIISLIRKEFRLTLIHSNWKKYKGSSSMKRILWSFAGGFILIFGARMAGGCTSGHVLSGGMQLAASSLIFAVFVFGGLLLTGKLFYRKS
jgi:uncharacterized protein